MHISSVLAECRLDAINHFKNSQPNTKNISNTDFLKYYYVGGLCKPRFFNHKNK